MNGMADGGMEPPMMGGDGSSDMQGGPMGPDMDSQPDMMGGGPDDNPYGADFDAGVDADEQTDPKKFIQQLTGKLSQSLRAYNEQQPRPDTDLNKYVAGMITRQAVQQLTPEETQEVIDRIKEDGKPQDTDMPDDEQSDPMMGGEEPTPSANMQQGPMEGVQHLGSRISELFQDLTQPKDDTDDCCKPTVNAKHRTYRNKPYTAPRFR